MKSFIRSLSTTFAVLAVLALLIYINYKLATALLRLGHDPIEEAKQWMAPVSTPVVLTARDPYLLAAARESLRKLGITIPKDLPEEHPLLLDISWVQAANPYPPLLAELNPGYGWSYFSFGYLGTDGKYHQISSFGGEADTTPSPFVKKVRGDETNEGDYFVEYVLLISREVTPRARTIDRESPSAPTIDAATWGTYEGGSYNGFEEIGMTAIATLVEWTLLLCLFIAWKIRRLRWRTGLHPLHRRPHEES